MHKRIDVTPKTIMVCDEHNDVVGVLIIDIWRFVMFQIFIGIGVSVGSSAMQWIGALAAFYWLAHKRRQKKILTTEETIEWLKKEKEAGNRV